MDNEDAITIIPVILAGGSGTRLWPLSRQLFPKQLLPLAGDRTMLQETLLRVADVVDTGAPLVVCNDQQRFMVAEQLRAIDQQGSILLEPAARNTAPAVAVAALEAMANGGDPILLVLPADHVIRDPEAFVAAVALAVEQAMAGRLVTFGIIPARPETGYGYIKAKSDGAPAVDHPSAFVVERFVEKPDKKSARRYVDSGEYYWNSGMFVFRASRFLAELEMYAPEMAECCRKSHQARETDLDFIRLEHDAFAASPADSIDYAVMERTTHAMVIPLDCGWSDVGSWASLWEIGGKDDDRNVLSGNVIAKDVRNCYIRSEARLVAAVGLEDTVVVETADAVLVAPMHRAQDVKAIVAQLRREKRDEATLHRRVYRPWGSYECVDRAERFQVKRIVVKPGARLSHQMHYHRAEHWIVVQGTARITNGDDIVILSENQSTYIPVGGRHRLENPGTIPLELIEVQSGSYLGEDDIVRFEDAYGRAQGKA